MPGREEFESAHKGVGIKQMEDEFLLKERSPICMQEENCLRPGICILFVFVYGLVDRSNIAGKGLYVILSVIFLLC